MSSRQGMSDFCHWLKEEMDAGGSFVCPKVEIAPIDDDSLGYGLFARGDIRPNEVLLKVPQRFIVSAHFVADIPEYADILEEFHLEPSEILALFFAFERIALDASLGQSSRDVLAGGSGRRVRHFLKGRGERSTRPWWEPYVAVLPRQFGTPLFAHHLAEDGEQRLRALAAQLPQQIKGKLLAQMDELEAFERKLFEIVNPAGETDEGKDRDYDILSGQFANAALEEGPGKEERPGMARFWREMCCWAWHVVNTRSIFVDHLPFHPLVDGPRAAVEAGNAKLDSAQRRRPSLGRGRLAVDYGGSLALIPLVDMINHRPEAQCTPLLDRHSGCYIVRAERAIMAGQQLFVCYGAHDNGRLWIEYGFRMEEPENPFNRVNMPLDLFISLAESSGLRVSPARREVLAKADLPCTIYATDELPSFAMRKNCSILLLPEEKLATWRRHIFASSEEGEEEDEGEGHREMRVLRPILERLEKALIGRLAGCGEDAQTRPFWEEQIVIVRRMLANLGAADLELGWTK